MYIFFLIVLVTVRDKQITLRLEELYLVNWFNTYTTPEV